MKKYIEAIRKVMFDFQVKHGFNVVFDLIDDQLREMEGFLNAPFDPTEWGWGYVRTIAGKFHYYNKDGFELNLCFDGEKNHIEIETSKLKSLFYLQSSITNGMYIQVAKSLNIPLPKKQTL